MKKILITGKNSYIGMSVSTYLNKWPEQFDITTISVRGDDWKDISFGEYDVIFHVAGIAHADTGKITEVQKKMYYQVNCDLSYKIAEKFKSDRKGKKSQFIYMSSIIVYDDKTNVRKKRVITADTEPNPSSYYGDSKLQAEKKLTPLDDEFFRLAIIRPPMIYGPNSKGNYPVLRKLSLKLPIFPKIKNERSMLYVGNLSEFLKQIIMLNLSGIYYPQNKEYVSTYELAENIANVNDKSIIITPIFNLLIVMCGFIPGKIGKLTNKAFGNLVYDYNLSKCEIDTSEYKEFEDSIKLTEENN